MSFFLTMKPIFFLCDKFCVLIVQIFSATFTFHFNIVVKFYVFDLSAVVYLFNHFRTNIQLKSKNNIQRLKLHNNTPIKFIHARIIHLSWSVVVFRNVFFSGNQTIFFIFLAVYEIKIIQYYIVLSIFWWNLFFFLSDFYINVLILEKEMISLQAMQFLFPFLQYLWLLLLLLAFINNK